jgi:hypothetical protein
MPRAPNSLRELASIFSALGEAQDNESIVKVFRDYCGGEKCEGAIVIKVINLFNSARDEIALTTLDNDVKEDHLEFLDSLCASFSASIISGKAAHVRDKTNAKSAKSLLKVLADLSQAAGGKPSFEIDRADLVSSTNELMQDIRESQLPSYARDAMSIKLDALIRIINSSSLYSEDEIRLRIKAIIADFLSEFESFDDDHKTTRERILAWGRKFTTGGAFALGLITDGTAVAGLLTGPK